MEGLAILRKTFYRNKCSAISSHDQIREVNAFLSILSLNPFRNVDTCSRRRFENMATKGEIVANEQLPLLPQRFQLFLVIIPTILEISHIF